MANELKLPRGADLGQYMEGQARHRQLELGTLGQFFGSDPAPAMVSVLAFVLTLALVGVLLFRPREDVLEVAQVLAPILTTVIGYLLGNRRRKS